MEITREMVEQSIAELRAKRDAMLADVQALNGAIQMNQGWLVIIDQPAEEVETD